VASRSLNVQITGDAKGLAVATRQADGHLDGLGKKTAMVTRGMALGFAAAGAAAAGTLVVGLKKSVDAAMDAQKSQARLEAQLKASGISFRAHAKEIDAVIQKHSQLAGLDDEDLQDAFTNIVRSTGSVNVAMKQMGLVSDIARAKHIDVAKAGQLVARVADGQVTALNRYGAGVDKNATKQEALAQLQQKFAGQADAYGKTAAGAQERFGVAVENLEEKVGGKLLPVLTDVTNKVATFVNQMESGTGAGGRFAAQVSDGFGKVKAVAEALWPVLKTGGTVALGLLTTGFGRMRTIVDAVAPTVIRLKDAISGWVSDNGPKIVAFSTMVRDRSVGAFNVLKGVVVTVFGAVKTAISAAVQFIRGWIDKHRDDIRAFGNAWKNVGKIVAGVALAIGTAVREVVEHVFVPVMKVALSVVKAVWPSIRKIVEGVLDALGGVVQVFSGIFTGDFDRIWTGVKSIFKGGVKAILGIVSGARRALLTAASGIGGVMKSTGSRARSSGLGNVPTSSSTRARRAGSRAICISRRRFGKLPVRRRSRRQGDRRRVRYPAVGGFSGALHGANQAMAPFAREAAGFGLAISSGRNDHSKYTASGHLSYHGSGERARLLRVRDAAGDGVREVHGFPLRRPARGAHLHAARVLDQGRPQGTSTPIAASDHHDHVHVAFDGKKGVGDGTGRKARTGDGLGRFDATSYAAVGRHPGHRDDSDRRRTFTAARTSTAVAVDPRVIRHRVEVLKITPNPFNYTARSRRSTRAFTIKRRPDTTSTGRAGSGRVTYPGAAPGVARTGSGGVRLGGGSGGSSSGGSGGSSAPRTGSSGGPAPTVDNKAIYGVTESTIPTFGNTFSGAPVKGRVGTGPSKGMTMDQATARQAVLDGAPTEFDYLDAALAQAESTAGTGDDRDALTAILGYRQRAYQGAVASVTRGRSRRPAGT
jgi:hypothetical protein